jgi:elongation factor P
MKQQANQIRPGWVIEHEGKEWSVIKINLIQPGKGGAFIQVDMRDVNTGIKTNARWRTVDTVEKLTTESFDCQYLYSEGDSLVFMNIENYDQFNVPADLMGDSKAFLQDGMQVVVDFIEGRPISVTLPPQVILTVTETEPSLKGQTVTTSYKPAMLENGLRITVPPFVNAGEKIVVSTADCSYVERAK